MMLPLAAIALVWHIVIGLWLLVAVSLILVVLLQKGRGGGLSGAFGGAGGTSSLLGTKTGDFLTWLTIGLVAFFLVMSVVMGLYMRPLPSSELSMPPVQTAPAASTEQPATPTEAVPVAAPTQPAPAQPSAQTPAPAAPTPTQPAGTDAPKP